MSRVGRLTLTIQIPCGELINVIFKPNPQFTSSSREAKVLKEMQGEIWINPKQQRLVSIHGQLMNDVKFAGGLLGHLDTETVIVANR